MGDEEEVGKGKIGIGKEEGKDNAEAQSTQSIAEKRNPRAEEGVAVERVREECAAPTALDEFLLLYPALTGWANFCRAYGAQKRKLPGENA